MSNNGSELGSKAKKFRSRKWAEFLLIHSSLKRSERNFGE